MASISNSKKAVIVTAFLNYDYDIRVKFLEEYLEGRGYRVEILSSNWDHRRKEPYSNTKENVTLIPVKEYKRNLSLERIESHIIFSRRVRQKIETMAPDLIYAIVPPNCLVRELGRYKKINPDRKLVFEVEDVWPESLPVNASLKKALFPILSVWAGIRDNSIERADAVVYECKLILNKICKDKSEKNHLIYLTRDDNYEPADKEAEMHEVGFLYIGSMNNLIDIDVIINLAKEVSKRRPMCLHLIGDGEVRAELIEKCKNEGIKYKFYGAVFDEDEKKEIISKCHYGLNIMKDTVEVGITMKSLEYFHYGLPLINNIFGDTSDIIKENQCGVNIYNLVDSVDEICGIESDQYRMMSRNVRQVYIEKFSVDSFYRRMDTLMSFICKNRRMERKGKES